MSCKTFLNLWRYEICVKKKSSNVAVRLTNAEKDWLEKEAYQNGRTISGEVRFRLRKQREVENAEKTASTN